MKTNNEENKKILFKVTIHFNSIWKRKEVIENVLQVNPVNGHYLLSMILFGGKCITYNLNKIRKYEFEVMK